MYKIMIIEDDLTLAGLIKSSLSKWGYEVFCVEDFFNVMDAPFIKALIAGKSFCPTLFNTSSPASESPATKPAAAATTMPFIP